MLEYGSGSAPSVSKKSAWSINKFSIARTNVVRIDRKEEVNA